MGYMVSHPVHYLITLQMLKLHVWNVIGWMVMQRTTCLKYEILDAISTKYVQCHIIKMTAMAIIEDHLCI